MQPPQLEGAPPAPPCDALLEASVVETVVSLTVEPTAPPVPPPPFPPEPHPPTSPRPPPARAAETKNAVLMSNTC